MIQQPLVSIITPCYNGENYLERFFESILNQTYKNIELIIINDGSTDGSEEIIMKHKPKVEEMNHSMVYLYQENAGQAAALNKGLKIFKGDFLVWTDSDDIIHPTNIEKKLEFLIKNHDKGFVQCYGKEVYENELAIKVRDFRRVPPIGEDRFLEDLILKKNVEYTPGIYMATREAILKALPTRSIYETRIGQNLQILMPLAYHYQGGYIAEELFSYVLRDESHSHSPLTFEQDVERINEIIVTMKTTLKSMQVSDEPRISLIIEESAARYKFEVARYYRQQVLLEKAYDQLKKLRKNTIRDVLAYLSVKHKVAKHIFVIMKKLKYVLKNNGVH